MVAKNRSSLAYIMLNKKFAMNSIKWNICMLKLTTYKILFFRDNFWNVPNKFPINNCNKIYFKLITLG